MSQFRNILVRTTNWVGDAVMTLPALRALRRALPDARITLLAKPWVSAVFEREGICDRILLYELGRPRVAGLRKMAAELRVQHFDAALLLQNAFEAALIARWAGIPLRAGYARDGRSALLTHAVSVPGRFEIPAHECYYYLELLRRLGIIDELPQVSEIVLDHPPAPGPSRQRLAAFGLSVEDGAKIVGINAGAAFGTAKRWPAERFASVGCELARQGAHVVLFGSPAERPLAEALEREIGPRAFSTAGRTSLADFLDVIAGCDLFLTNDTGTMHLAAAARVPVVAVFGPTDDVATPPLGPAVRIVKHPVECSPCKLRHCPIDHRCMLGVTVEQVLAACAEALAHQGRH
jgi:heptosyltransferase II